jgi:hypothetical protein
LALPKEPPPAPRHGERQDANNEGESTAAALCNLLALTRFYMPPPPPPAAAPPAAADDAGPAEEASTLGAVLGLY